MNRSDVYFIAAILALFCFVMYCGKTPQPQQTSIKAEYKKIDSLHGERKTHQAEQPKIERELKSLPAQVKIKYVEKVIPQIVQINDTVFQIDVSALDTINILQSRVEYWKQETALADSISSHRLNIIHHQDTLISEVKHGKLKLFLKGFGIGFGAGLITGKAL